MFHVPNKYRVRTGALGTDDTIGNNGLFYLKKGGNDTLTVIASDGAGWEHVSVSRIKRTPTWAEMCYVKDMFWDAEDVVLQYHPAKSQHVDNHPYCLHLWRPIGIVLPVPDPRMVGTK